MRYEKPQLTLVGDAARLIEGAVIHKLEPDGSGPPGQNSD